MITRRQGLKLAAVLTLAGAVPFGRSAFAETKTIRIGWQKFGVLALAKQQGALEKRFADRGINIEWSEFTSGPPLLEALGAGSLDFGPTGDVPPLFAQAARGDLLYVGTYKPPAAFHGILVHKDSPIKTLADLKGVKLAYKRGSSAHNFAFKALAKAGLTPSDVQEVDLPPPDAAAAFKNGSIDAWSIWDPYFAIAEKDPDARLLTTSEGIVEAWGYFLGNGAFTAANPEVVSEILDELAKVGAAAQADIDGTTEALSKITGVPADVTRVTLTRAGSDLGKVATVSDEAVAYQQALADDFHAFGVLPRKLTISDIVWRPKAS
ncbi:aliphatic sulfonate ABC transporter substrate-binding protein [Rhizobium sp. S153]|uniref:Aliphatic sulfonate ABC transporter substrate-binding protein n=1 Tax=Ciceribacter sichuanensis TaxID=2949647 RepID=A0ABT0V123_9HYPH|nr:aliphatic sulfonate ABC transporter substrate-binding protein [Ciceribacter sp. S153]MCM2399527.1 aliphatic sulfonate ABC transporter substrate-binding protein [Ciceribacter sp. S153]